MDTEPVPHNVRALFLSDIHLGSRACRAEELLSFIKDYEPEYIFLVGDIVDFWAMSRGVYWPAAHNTVVQKLLKKARHHVKVVLIPGNHDEALREYIGSSFGDIVLVRDYIHTAADGRRYLLLHGDEYDQVTAYHRWVSVLGDVSYSVLVRLNRMLSLLRRKLGVSGHWSLADYAKRSLKGALEFVYGFEESVAHHVRRSGFDGVVCGHIHSAAIKDIGGITYINCGDWVDSCTAVVEHSDGCMELLRWDEKEELDAVAAVEEELLPETTKGHPVQPTACVTKMS
jgi:UDP-2,3-diacylglucosamine pyrophosphatase LpxH